MNFITLQKKQTMLSEKLYDALNKQIGEEFYSSNLYLAMSSWFDKEGLNNCAQFMLRHFQEEQVHMLKFVNYINEMDGHAIIPALPQPPKDFESAISIFKDAFEHEKYISKTIHDLVKLSSEENNYRTLNFLQWFVEEQREEETTFQKILDKIKLIGDGTSSLYYI